MTPWLSLLVLVLHSLAVALLPHPGDAPGVWGVLGRLAGRLSLLRFADAPGTLHFPFTAQPPVGGGPLFIVTAWDERGELAARPAPADGRIDPERVFPTGVPGAASQSILGPDGQPVSSASAFNEPAFSAEERFTRIEGTLDDIVSRFGLAA